MKFLHLSDLHYHTDPADNVEADTLLLSIKKKYPEHFLIITGDITDDGSPNQYLNAGESLLPFKDRIFLVPGNHDFGAAGNFYDEERAVRFDEMLSIRFEQGGLFAGYKPPVVNVLEDIVLIGLDSNLETLSPFDFACGEIGRQQLIELDRILNTHKDKKKVLFLHHHLFIRDSPFMELRDASSLARVIYGRVDVVLFGHNHKRSMWETRWGIKYIVASDNSPGKKEIGELSVENGEVGFRYVEV